MNRRGIWIMVVVFLMCTGVSKAQDSKHFFQIQEHDYTSCASDVIHQRMLIEDDSYRNQFEMQSEALRSSILRNQDSPMRNGTVYTIPVVVHVMHTGEAVGSGTNISDAQIQSAIDGLNEDYRRTPGSNGDGNGVDVEMEFCLAARDPQGNPTNGINRIDASVVTNYASEGISIGQGSGASETAVKDLSRWNRDDYYNIWIVNEIEDNDGGAGIQGFAYFPSSSASKDGAVILYNAFGTVGTLKSYTSLNRTATHELGHAFFLYHTFQGNSCSESNCATQGDQVCDTPPTVSNTGCASPACGGTQQVENYMDYTYETCMDMFTQGQKDRMRNALTTMRSSLLSSLGCTPPNALDIGISDITSPEGFMCNGSFTPEVEISNFGSNTISSAQVRYRVDNGSLQTYIFSGSLASGESQWITLPTLTSAPGSHTFECYTQAPNGGADGFQSNDDSSTDFEVVSGTTVTVSIDVDNYGNETTWDIQDASGNVMASGGPYPANAYGTTFESEVCLANDCYDFTIYDSYGDGICCGYGFGGYEVTDDSGNILAESGTDFEDFETTEICLSGSASSNPPNAQFSADHTLICEGGAVQFSDLSSGTPTAWSWTFAGGTPSSSTAQHPTVTFNSPGNKNITLTVTNANGSDTETKMAFISVGSEASLSADVSDLTCHNAADGAVNLSVSGGSSPYVYSWSNGASSQDISGLAQGNYSVTVSDAAGCQVSGNYTVSAPNAISISTSSNSASCVNDGSASVSASGGTPGYTYLWNDAQQQTTQTATALASGTYTVIVTDASGCQASGQVTVTGSGTIDLSNGQKTHVTCHGDADGSATVNPQGGEAPYSYQWSNGQTGATATGLSGGSIGVTVTDATGCQESRTFFIQEPDALEIDVIQVTEESCPGIANGAISAEILGGTTPYSFHWNGAGLGQTLDPDGIASGSYDITSTDANGCATTETIQVPQGDGVSISMSGTDETCAESNNGSITVVLQGGSTPYSFNWNGAGLGQTLEPQGVSAGQYTFNVTDADGCQSTQQYTVSEPNPIMTTLTSVSPDSCDLNVGSAQISVQGGTGAKSVQWDDDEFQTGMQLQNVRFGIYTADISDANQCASFFTVEVEEAECLPLGVAEPLETRVDIFPNPIDGNSFVLVTELGAPVQSVVMIDITGQSVQRWDLDRFDQRIELELNKEYAEGMYFVRVNAGTDQYTQKVFIR